MNISENEAHSAIYCSENEYFARRCRHYKAKESKAEWLGDVIILDGDQIVYNSSILTPEFERSGYNCVWIDEETDEWLLTVEDGVVKSPTLFRSLSSGNW